MTDIDKAIEYFEDAIKESDEIIEECSEDLKANLTEQKGYFITALKAMKKQSHHKLVEIIARNLVAWDTSKDKKHGLLPEVYLANKVAYRELTGEEYEFIKACKKFCIGDDWS